MIAGIAQCKRGDEGFVEKVTAPLYNKLPIDRTPDLLVTPSSEDEVVRAVRAARQAGLKIAVRSGGHSWIGASVRDSGMLIDMKAFDRVAIDAAKRTARVGSAVRSDHFGRALAKEGLAFPIGHCGGPAMGGYLLAGGLGLNWGLWQPACFSVRSIRGVTAAGELVVASESTNSELLWMARGAGQGFPGVITEFELELKDRPADVRVSSWFFPLDALDDVTRWVSDASAGLPANVELAVTTIGPERSMLSPGNGMPSHLVGVSALAFVDNENEARKALSALSAGPPGVGSLMRSDLEPIPFENLHLGADATHPEGQRVLADTFWTDRSVHATLTPLSTIVAGAASGKSFVVAIMPGHGARSSGVPTGAGAYSMDERTLALAYAVWEDPAADNANQKWMSQVVRPLEETSTGHFLGETDLRRPERAARSFSKGNWDRLTELRLRWDPDRVFHGFPEMIA